MFTAEIVSFVGGVTYVAGNEPCPFNGEQTSVMRSMHDVACQT
jgi:hypothetical protein